jgi:DNA-binding NarL/FixJ family response regulator
MTKRTVLVDGNPILRFGLREILTASAEVAIVGEASRCNEACAAVSLLRPDLVVFDLELEDACGGEVIRRFRDRFPSLLAVIYTARREPEIIAEALACGIQGYMLKTSPNERIREAVEHVAAGRAYLDPDITATVLAQVANAPEQREERPTLSAKEQAVLLLLASGRRNKQIAEDLHITERTVKFHVSSILRQLQATNRTEAVRTAERLRLLPVPLTATLRTGARTRH